MATARKLNDSCSTAAQQLHDRCKTAAQRQLCDSLLDSSTAAADPTVAGGRGLWRWRQIPDPTLAGGWGPTGGGGETDPTLAWGEAAGDWR